MCDVYVYILEGWWLPYVLWDKSENLKNDSGKNILFINLSGTRFLKIACPMVLFGHFIDFYLMVTPGVLKENGGIGFLEIGILMIFLSAFLYVILNGLKKLPLVAKNHPMLEESLHHDI